MELFVFWLIATGLIMWWASTSGRSVGWALVGSILLSPLIWGLVLLVLGRANTPAAQTAAPPRDRAPTAKTGRLPAGVARCGRCGKTFSPSDSAWSAGSSLCPRCKSTVSLRAPSSSPAQLSAEADPFRDGGAWVNCPECLHGFRVGDGSMTAGAATCPSCKADLQLRLPRSG